MMDATRRCCGDGMQTRLEDSEIGQGPRFSSRRLSEIYHAVGFIDL